MPKSYSQYKYEDLDNLQIEIKLRELFLNIATVLPTDFLVTTIDINSKQPLTTEKAKSEFIIAPILYEIARKNSDKVSFFSGYNFDVNKALGLKGFCDFIFTKYPASTIIKEPVFCVVEAKNDNVEKGVPQCVAEMYAAMLFNKQKKKEINVIYGCVTFGFQWLFLKMENNLVSRDTKIYELHELPKILGILQHIVEY
jgi:hypothetical protein